MIRMHNPKEWPIVEPDPRCKCKGPFWIVVPPGKHIHPCPIHPNFALYGSRITC